MKFRSPVSIAAAQGKWSHRQRFVALGSCFADEIGTLLHEALFPVVSNPFGSSFNPLALARSIERALSSKPFIEAEFFQQLELWRHFDLHSSLAQPRLGQAVAGANTAQARLAAALENADWLLLTLGTAYTYRHLESGIDVGHNHRLDASRFERRLLPPEAVAESVTSALDALRRRNPKLKTLITVSPVRHLRDGLRENNLSKASLLLAAQSIEQSHPSIEYFPAYEILLDELRDYRFYADDFAHPSPLAIRYIWDRLAQTYFSAETRELCEEIDSLRAALRHRPHHPDTAAHRAFCEQQAKRLEALDQRGLDTQPLRAFISP